MERWLEVPGFEGRYEVSDLGRVRSMDYIDSVGRFRRSAIKTQRESPMGYKIVSLYVNGTNSCRFVHTLVLAAFVGPRPSRHVGCHEDDNPSNNRLANLRWKTQKQNQDDCVARGRHPIAAATSCSKGHEWTVENTYVRPDTNYRQCRTCAKLRKR